MRLNRGRTVRLGVGGAVERILCGGGVHNSSSLKSPFSMYEIGRPSSSTLRRSSLCLNSFGNPSLVATGEASGGRVLGSSDSTSAAVPSSAGRAAEASGMDLLAGDLAPAFLGLGSPGVSFFDAFGEPAEAFLGVLGEPATASSGVSDELPVPFWRGFPGDPAFAAGFPLAGEADDLPVAGILAALEAFGDLSGAAALDGVLPFSEVDFLGVVPLAAGVFFAPSLEVDLVALAFFGVAFPGGVSEPFFAAVLAAGDFLAAAFGVDDFFAGVVLSDFPLAGGVFLALVVLAGVDLADAGLLAAFGVAFFLSAAGVLPFLAGVDAGLLLAGDAAAAFEVLAAPFGDGFAATSALSLAGDSLALGDVFAPFPDFEGVSDFLSDVFFVGDLVFPGNFFEGVSDLPFFVEAGDAPFFDLSGDLAVAAPLAEVALAEPFDLVGVFLASGVAAFFPGVEEADFFFSFVVGVDDFLVDVVFSSLAGDFFLGVADFLLVGEEGFLAAVFAAGDPFFDGVEAFPGVFEADVFFAADLAFVGDDTFFGVFPLAGVLPLAAVVFPLAGVVTICLGILAAALPGVPGDFLGVPFDGVFLVDESFLGLAPFLVDPGDFLGLEDFFAGVFFAAIEDFFEEFDDCLRLATDT